MYTSHADLGLLADTWQIEVICQKGQGLLSGDITRPVVQAAEG